MTGFLSHPNPSTPGLHGTRQDAVVTLIHERLRKKERGLDWSDGRRLALVLEGGGMRGAVPAGGALALDHLGAAEVFDDVYATSAAVMNASYMLSGQGDLGISVYFEDLASSAFYSMWRLWKVIDVDYVIEQVVSERKPLDCESVKAARARLHVAVMDYESGVARTIDTGESEESLMVLLHAALAIPVFYNRTVPVGNGRLMDGGLSIPFPLKEAIGNGSTDVLNLLSHQAGYSPQPFALWQRLVFNLLCARGRKALNQAFAEAHERSREYRALALGSSTPDGSVNIATICPNLDSAVHTTTMEHALLRREAADFGRRTLISLGFEPGSWELGPRSSLKR